MKVKFAFVLFISVLLSLGAVCFSTAADYYVDADTGHDNNYGTEESPWRTITHALDWIASNNPGSDGNAHTIHVAAGTYAASTNGETYPLNMQSWVCLVGDDPETTILDAEEGAYHLIYCHEVDNLSIVELTITGGYADGPNDNDKRGAGIHSWYSSPTIQGNIITANSTEGNDAHGGGIYCYYGSPVIEGNVISANVADEDGGGISCRYSSPDITDNTINGNSAGDYGGGVSCYYSSPTIESNTITSNNGGTTGKGGGGINCFHSSPTIANNTVVGNEAYRYGGAVFCEDSCLPIYSMTTLLGIMEGPSIALIIVRLPSRITQYGKTPHSAEGEYTAKTTAHQPSRTMTYRRTKQRAARRGAQVFSARMIVLRT